MFYFILWGNCEDFSSQRGKKSFLKWGFYFLTFSSQILFPDVFLYFVMKLWGFFHHSEENGQIFICYVFFDDCAFFITAKRNSFFMFSFISWWSCEGFSSQRQNLSNFHFLCFLSFCDEIVMIFHHNNQKLSNFDFLWFILFMMKLWRFFITA